MVTLRENYPNTDQEKLLIWTFFTQCQINTSHAVNSAICYCHEEY